MEDRVKLKAAEVVGMMVMKVMDLSGQDIIILPADFTWLNDEDKLALAMAQDLLR
jgi:hypothetical protein